MGNENAIYVVTHKECSIPQLDGYLPIFVGPNSAPASYLRDNSGINISYKNDSYCELTAQYWVWKNINFNITGFVHYRRFFYNTHFFNKAQDIVSLSQFITDLQEYDIILPEYLYSKNTLAQDYSNYHNINDLIITKDVLTHYDAKAVIAFDEVMNSHRLAPYNMFVMGPELYSEYMQWLFDLMDLLEQKIDYNQYDSYNRRVFGFLSERLLNTWVISKKLHAKRYPVHRNDGKTYSEVIKNDLKHVLFGRL